MTASGFERRNHGRNHSYFLNGQRLPGVTTIIDVLNKPALTQWAATTVAEYAVSEWERLSGMSEIARYEELKTAHRKVKTATAVRGNRIHAIAERLMRGEEISTDDQDLRSAAEAYARLLDDWELEAVATEMPCVNLDYAYAGTADGIFWSPKLGTVIADVKTGKRAYSEVALQLAAYRNCDLYLEEEEQFGPRGGKRKSLWHEKEMPEVNGAVVIHIERETDESPAVARLLPVYAGEDVWDQFLYLREIYAGWIERTSFDHNKSPNYAPPIGAELHPEQPFGEINEAVQS